MPAFKQNRNQSNTDLHYASIRLCPFSSGCNEQWRSNTAKFFHNPDRSKAWMAHPVRHTKILASMIQHCNQRLLENILRGAPSTNVSSSLISHEVAVLAVNGMQRNLGGSVRRSPSSSAEDVSQARSTRRE